MTHQKDTYIFVLVFWIFFSSCLFCQQESFQELEQKVERYLKGIDQKKEMDVWKAASRLESLGEKAVPIIKLQIPKVSDMGKIVCLKTLLAYDQKDYCIHFLMEILETGKSKDAIVYAADLLSIYGDYEIEERLVKMLDNTLDSYTKISISKVLWQVAKNNLAKKNIKEFLDSSNEDLRFAAALALGEMGDISEAKLFLAQLKNEPSLRGRLARSLLDQESTINRYENLLSNAPKPSQPKPSLPAKTPNKYDVLEEVVEKIKEYHVYGDSISEQTLIDAAIKGMAEKTDIHSCFWTEKEWDDFIKSTINEEYVGIGVYVNKQNGVFTVIAPLYSGPAYKAGIRSKDQILKIDGTSISHLSMEELQKRIKGEKGTNIVFTVYRAGWAKEKEITLTREPIRIPSLFYDMLPASIGYIRLTQFGQKATQDMENALQILYGNGMKGLILDLRNNGGGWLETAIEIADKFLDKGKLIAYSEGRNKQEAPKQVYNSTERGDRPYYPMAILVDSSSASASEIVAGSLSYHKRAVLVGQKTFGKGSVQRPYALNNRPDSRLKITIAMYYLPDGRCINNEMDSDGKILKYNGIDPEIEVKEEENQEAAFLEEKEKLDAKNAFKEYVDQYYLSHKELLQSLADNDHNSFKLYPDFEKWYHSLQTKASQDHVRKWLRTQIRRVVSDERGKEYACNYLEDKVLQKGILYICEKNSVIPSQVQEYEPFVEKK
ncbi:MAG: PDZ domain-containing protein [Candidatus Brocadiae bacterium]|nr:PDZ domain-containing protein [Candidatus Brocadiia bacterium]